MLSPPKIGCSNVSALCNTSCSVGYFALVSCMWVLHYSMYREQMVSWPALQWSKVAVVVYVIAEKWLSVVMHCIACAATCQWCISGEGIAWVAEKHW